MAARRSSLSLSEARENLSTLVSKGASSNEIRNAQLGVQEAEESRTKTILEQHRAHTDRNVAEKKGVAHNGNVLSATNALRSATQALAAAKRADAKATAKQSTAVETLHNEIAKLDPAEKRLYGTLKRFKKTFESR